jgi:hypothetical protein
MMGSWREQFYLRRHKWEQKFDHFFFEVLLGMGNGLEKKRIKPDYRLKMRRKKPGKVKAQTERRNYGDKKWRYGQKKAPNFFECRKQLNTTKVVNFQKIK